MRNIFLAIDILIAIGLLSLSVVTLIRDGYKNEINRLFAGFSVLVGLWILSNDISINITLSSQVATIADYFVFASSLGGVILLTQFIVKITKNKKLDRYVNWLLGPLWILCILSGTPLVTAGVEVQGELYAVKFGPLIFLYGIGLFLLIGIICYGIFYGLRHTRGVTRRHVKTISIGLAFTVPLCLLFGFILPAMFGLFYATEFEVTPVIILVISLYYGVVKYQLFDIRRALVRTMTYVFSLLTLSVVYYSLAYLVSLAFFSNQGNINFGINPVNIILAILLAFIFQPIKRFFDKITNKIFYKDSYNTEDFIAKLNRTLTITTDLRNLLERASYEIGTTMKSEQAFFYIYTEEDHYVSAGTERHRQLPRYDANKIGQNFDKTNKILIASLMEPDDPIRKLMVSHRIELILTLIHDDKIIGYLCLGEHLTSGYTNRDVRALNTISNELVIAIQNALAVNEVKELNATLQQKVANATKELRSSNAILRQLDKVKDEFISMASHQLRTPLTSVKGYISMVIEGDAGKISEPQKKLLNEAFMSSERMVHLINDFLNVSRIQSGKFIIDKTPVDLVKLVQEEIDGLKPNADARGMKFKYTHPKDFPQIYIDEGKMRQVVMNFADNAIYYSHDKSVIDIFLGLEDNEITFYVKDKGIGVPEKEKEHLFTKFYRADNARVQRPDGTGVGIYLAKKVIDAHGGKIIFDSIEGKGSTFGFGLPLNVVSTAPSGRLESEQVPQL